MYVTFFTRRYNACRCMCAINVPLQGFLLYAFLPLMKEVTNVWKNGKFIIMYFWKYYITSKHYVVDVSGCDAMYTLFPPHKFDYSLATKDPISRNVRFTANIVTSNLIVGLFRTWQISEFEGLFTVRPCLMEYNIIIRFDPLVSTVSETTRPPLSCYGCMFTQIGQDAFSMYAWT